MKRFMYFSIAMLCLSIAVLIGFYVGSQSVQAQATDAAVGYRVLYYPPAMVFEHFVMLPNGDVYARQSSATEFTPAHLYLGNFWDGAVPTSGTTWGDVKSKYQGNK